MPPGASGHVLNPVTWPGWPWESGWVPQWDPQQPSDLGQRVGLVYACIERVSSALSAMPLAISKDSLPQTPRPWLTNPDPQVYTHVGDAVTEMVWSLLTTGNAWLLPTAVYDDGYPQAWRVLDPGMVRWEQGWEWAPDQPMPWPYVVWDAEQVMYVPNRYTGKGRGGWVLESSSGVQLYDERGVALRYRPGELVHIRLQSRPGRRLGVSPLTAAAASIEAVAGYQAMAGKLGARSGLPVQGILSTDQDIPEQTAERYKQKWQARGDGDVAVLGSGLRFDSLSLSPRDLALLELREFDGRAIAAAFGVPPFMVNLAAAGDLTYSTTQGMMDYFWRQTLKPLAVNIGRALGTMLPGRSAVLFEADEYTRGTQSEHFTSLVAASGGPVLTREEARIRLNLPPVGDADQVLAVVSGGVA